VQVPLKQAPAAVTGHPPRSCALQRSFPFGPAQMPEQQRLDLRHRFPTFRQPNRFNAGFFLFLRLFFRCSRFSAAAASRRVAITSDPRMERAPRRVDHLPSNVVRASKRWVFISGPFTSAAKHGGDPECARQSLNASGSSIG
jgi:hypothetical protein